MTNEIIASVVIPCRNEENFIEQCLLSIIKSDFNNDNLEIIVVDGISDDKTVEIINKLSKQYSNIHLLHNPDKVVPNAMNIGIEKAVGRYIVRMDAHSIYPKDYIVTLINSIQKLDADNVGGVWVTTPANDSLIAQAIALSTSHPFGIGNAYYRLNVAEPMEVDTVPFGCYKKEVFNKIGNFDTDLIRNQDDELNARLIQSGGKIFLIPSVKIIYFARATFSKMSKMFYQYGYFKPLVNIKLRHPATIRQFVPLLFVLFLFFGTFLTVFFEQFKYIFFPVLSIYILGNIYASLKIAELKKKYKLVPFLFLSFVLIHISYGYGYLKGILDFVILKKHKDNKIKINISR